MHQPILKILLQKQSFTLKWQVLLTWEKFLIEEFTVAEQPELIQILDKPFLVQELQKKIDNPSTQRFSIKIRSSSLYLEMHEVKN